MIRSYTLTPRNLGSDAKHLILTGNRPRTYLRDHIAERVRQVLCKLLLQFRSSPAANAPGMRVEAFPLHVRHAHELAL